MYNEFKRYVEENGVRAAMDGAKQMALEVIREWPSVEASDVGFDPRCGTVYYDHDDEAICFFSKRTADYYGGMEYHSNDCKMDLDDACLYFIDYEECEFYDDEDEDGNLIRMREGCRVSSALDKIKELTKGVK